MSETLAEAVMRFQKARFYLRCWALTPEETQVLQEMLEKKGNETMDEELFTEETVARLTIPEGASPRNSEYYESLVVDIETYTNHALKLQMAVIEAESKLAKAKRRHRKADLRLAKASQQWSEADRALDDARAMLEKHLNLIRKTHVTLRKGRHE